MKRLAIFASGSGSNAENIINYFKNHKSILIDSVWSNNKDAYVLERAKKLEVEAHFFTKSELTNRLILFDKLVKREIDVIILAGFLLLVPQFFINKFVIINIHPALLPKYGGKGMYGNFVHNSVIENGETESGITIHKVDEKYDKGEILLQARCEVLPTDTAETLAARIHQLEFEYFPIIIERYLS